MKDNLELERSDIRVDGDMEVDCDIGQQITAYIETWFDAAKKFASHTDTTDIDWINMYAKYNPFEDTLLIECEVNKGDSISYFDYTPTPGEAKLIKGMITEQLQNTHGQSPQEFCNNFYGDSPGMEVLT